MWHLFQQLDWIESLIRFDFFVRLVACIHPWFNNNESIDPKTRNSTISDLIHSSRKKIENRFIYVFIVDKSTIFCLTRSFDLRWRISQPWLASSSPSPSSLPPFYHPCDLQSAFLISSGMKLFASQAFGSEYQPSWLQGNFSLIRGGGHVARSRKPWRGSFLHDVNAGSSWNIELRENSNRVEFFIARRTNVNDLLCVVDVSGQLLMTRRSRLSSICDPDGEMIRKLQHT